MNLYALYIIALFNVTLTSPATEPPAADEIKWYTWEEAYELNQTAPKKVFIDLYTDWCGWCKKMDKETFTDPAVVKFINENFYAVKFDAEQEKDIVFNEKTFTFIKSGRRGCLLYTSPSPRDQRGSRMPSSA